VRATIDPEFIELFEMAAGYVTIRIDGAPANVVVIGIR
jgi:hypothetical protein